MRTILQRLLSSAAFGAGIALVTFGAPSVFAGVGGPAAAGERLPPVAARPGVLPASARPFGFSLADMALLTASFNSGDRSGPPPTSPFQILYENTVTNGTTFNVDRGRFLYVPILWSDNSAPVLGDFPADASNRRQLLPYWYSQTEVGVVATDVTVDGVSVPIGAPYVIGVLLPQPLPDGATQYIAPAVFIAPLAPGVHSVGIHSKATGDALRKPPFDQYFPDGYYEFTTTYTVNVK